MDNEFYKDFRRFLEMKMNECDMKDDCAAAKYDAYQEILLELVRHKNMFAEKNEGK